MTSRTNLFHLPAALLLAAVAGSALPASAEPQAPATIHGELPALAITSSRVTISGLSSGAYMAQQLHMAHGERFAAAAILAGGPWNCAENSIAVALTRCMKPSGALDADINRLVAQTRAAAARGDLAPLEAVAGDQVYIYSSPDDTVVQQAVSDGLHAYYRAFVPDDQVHYVNSRRGAHAMPTDDFGYPCEHEGASSNPDDHFINNCGWDAAGELLQHGYRRLKAPKRDHSLSGYLLAFDQDRFIADPKAHGMGPTGYAYLPARCANGGRCKLHIALHGCLQGAERIGETYVRHAGYNDWADRNRMVVLYPQAAASLHEGNGNGCWDWWGYDDAGYATRHGRQMQAVIAMLDQLTSGGDDSAEPAAPSGLQVISQLGAAVTLGWDHQPHAAGYTLYHAEVAGGPYLQVAADVLLDEQVTLAAPGPGNHHYVLVAVDASGVEGAPSNELSVSVPGL